MKDTAQDWQPVDHRDHWIGMTFGDFLLCIGHMVALAAVNGCRSLVQLPKIEPRFETIGKFRMGLYGALGVLVLAVPIGALIGIGVMNLKRWPIF